MDKPSPGPVEEVKDEDTMIVLHDGQTSIVHLHGFCAPELSQPHGKEAAAYLRAQVEGREVVVRVRDRDRLERLVARVFLD